RAVPLRRRPDHHEPDRLLRHRRRVRRDVHRHHLVPVRAEGRAAAGLTATVARAMSSAEEHGAHAVTLGSRLPAARLAPADAGGTVLATPLTARLDVPPFDNSAMDGFAVRAADLAAGSELDVLGDAPAGSTGPPAVAPGTAVRVMTGAPL